MLQKSTFLFESQILKAEKTWKMSRSVSGKKEPLDPKHKEMVSFQKRITKYKNNVITFLYHPNVPPDNNGSERAIGNVRVKQKISGQFKILKAAENFPILRSIIDTAIKNSQNVEGALSVIAANKRNGFILLLTLGTPGTPYSSLLISYKIRMAGENYFFKITLYLYLRSILGEVFNYLLRISQVRIRISEQKILLFLFISLFLYFFLLQVIALLYTKILLKV